MSAKFFQVSARILTLFLITGLALVLFPTALVSAGGIGPSIAGAGANVPASDNNAWSNPGNITVENHQLAEDASTGTQEEFQAAFDQSFASVLVPRGEISDYLYATNFGFAIPEDAVINGIQVSVWRADMGPTGNRIRDNEVRLLKNNLRVGANYAQTWFTWYRFYNTQDTLRTTTYGSVVDLWDTTWTAADINDPNFGVALAVRNYSTDIDRVAVYDYVKIAVTYDLADTTMTVSSASGTYGYTINLSATIAPAVSGKTVTFSLPDSGGTCTATTNSSGEAPCSMVLRNNAGTYLNGITASFNGDFSHKPSSAANDLTVNRRPITVTAATDTKPYDGSVSSSAVPTITSGSVYTRDIASWTQAFANRHAGTGKTITPTGVIYDRGGGDVSGNYTITFIDATSGVINPLPISVTAADDTKVYDGTTNSTATPTITSGALAVGDTAAWTQSFDTRHAGAGKSLIPAGTVEDGNNGLNYLVTLINSTNGTITAFPITVSAVSATKPYDGDASAVGAPLITAGSLFAGDTGSWTQSFDNRNAGTNKSIIPSGSVSDGNNGGNYFVSFAPVTTGVIEALPVTVTAAPSAKTYDGTTASAETPTITSGALIPGDTAAWAQSFDTRHAGSNKTISPSGSINDGNNGENYAVTFQSISSGVINARALTVTAVTATKTYDGATGAPGTPIVSSPLSAGDSATWTQSFDTRHVGTGKTITPSGTIDDGNDGANYNLTLVPVTDGVIEALPITVTAVPATKEFDGTTTASGTPVTSIPLANGDTASWTQSFDTPDVGAAKTLTPAGAIDDGNGGANYIIDFAPVASGEITRRSITVTAVTATKTYDGNTTASGTPTITSGSLVAGDTAIWTQSFDTRHAGVGKTITPAGSISNSAGGNYSVTFSPVSTGVINPMPLTVTAVSASKVYDGTTSAPGVPTLSGALVSSDTAALTQAFDTRHIGTGKTIIPSGSIDDGNNGANYALSFINAASGVITAREITVTAVPESRRYDRTNRGDATPVITLGELAPGDTAVWTQSFDNHHAGTGKTLTPAGEIQDENNGHNYLVTFAPVTEGVIEPFPLTVTARSVMKTYDGNTSADYQPETSGSPVSGDEARWSQAFLDPNVGDGKTITPSGVIEDGNGGLNYIVEYISVTDGQIKPRQITIRVDAKTKAFGGADPALTYRIDQPLIGTDTFSGSLERTAGENVGAYPILIGTLDLSDNYIIVYIGANLTIQPADQTITVTTPAPASASHGDTFTVAASSSSGLPVVYTASGACTNAEALFTITGSTGVCLVQYDQAGNTNFNPASPVVETVVINVAPVLTLDPEDITINPGEDASFTAAASGTPAPSIQWQYSADGGATFINLAGEVGGTLTLIAPSQATNNYLYRAVFTNAAGTVTSRAAKLQFVQQQVEFYYQFIPMIIRSNP